MKKMLEKLENQREEFKHQAHTMKEEVEKLKLELSNQAEKPIDKGGLEDLQQKNEALESKLRKFLAHYEHLENECTTLKEENKSIPLLQVELKNVNLELERVSSSQFESSEKVAGQLNELNNKLKVKNDEQMKRNAAYDELKEKYKKQKEINQNLKNSSTELEREKNRQISYLESENLQYLGELKQMKKQMHSMKAQRRMQEIDDEPTEDLGSIISSKMDYESLNENDKENCPNQYQYSKKSYSVQKEKRVGQEGGNISKNKIVGLGESVSHEDEPGECKQS